MEKKKLWIFDFDGTLVDTLTDVAICFNAALEQCGFSGYPVEQYAGFVGGNLETVVARLLPPGQNTPENVDRVKNVYRKIYQETNKIHTRPYPGILPLLLALKERGCKLAVNTNKGQMLVDDLINVLFPAGLFAKIVGYVETRPSKPDPFGIDLICTACGASRQTVIYVGDGKSDIDTAANAAVPIFLVDWGQGTLEDKTDPRVTARARIPADLLSFYEDMK